jgi:hypothetical protein
MAAPTPTTEPTSLTAGDTAKWLKTLPDYLPTDGWSLAYTLINAASKISITTSASGTDHLVNVDAATTAGWAAGSYSWRAQVSKAGEVYTIASGTITVQPSFGTATLDNRSFARIALANIEAYLQNSANLAAASYEIAGRKLHRFTPADLLALRDRYRFEVRQEDAAAAVAQGLPDPRRVMVRFGP